jgi:hypothetical protein
MWVAEKLDWKGLKLSDQWYCVIGAVASLPADCIMVVALGGNIFTVM